MTTFQDPNQRIVVLLRVTGGPEAGKEVPLGPQPAMVGSRDDADLQLSGDGVAPAHCDAWVDPATGLPAVRDRGAGTTFVNGRPLSGLEQLHAGQQLRIDDQLLEIVASEPPARERTPARAGGTATLPPPVAPPEDAGPLRPPEGPGPWRARGLLGVVVLGALGVMLLANLLLGPEDVEARLLALGAAMVPAPLLIGLVLLIDRFEPEPPRLLAVTFLYGATAAVALAGMLNVAGASLLADAYHPDAAQLLTITTVAPIVEEVLKGAAVLFIYWRYRSEFTGAISAIVYSAMVGLGFAISENAFHYLGALATGEEAFAATLVARGLFSPFAHPLFTVMFGIGLAIASESARWRALAAVAGLLTAVMLHGVWNAATLTGPGFLLVYVAVFVPLFLIVLGTAVHATRREGRLLRHYLSEEVQRGTLTQAQLDTLSSLRRRRRAEREAAASGGGDAKQVRRSFHHAATQLAFTRHRRREGRGRRVPSAQAEDFWQRETLRRRELAQQAAA